LEKKKKAIEALRRAKFKFPGQQKVVVSNKWGFTKFSVQQYQKLKSQGRIIPDGCYCKLVNYRGLFVKQHRFQQKQKTIATKVK